MKNPSGDRQSCDAFKSRTYFNALDGLRAVSILMVLFHHVTKYPAQHWLQTLQENGRYGVAFFFVISGFLICTLFLREEEGNGRIDLWKFYGRRALRLLPLYYAALLLQAVTVFALHLYTPENEQIFREKLPAYLFYYSNWLATATQGPFFQSWSLAVEEQFYLAFGLLLFFVRRRLVVGAVLAAWCVKFFVFTVFGTVDADSTLWRIVFSYQEPVLFGVLIAFAMNCRRYYEVFARWLGGRWVSAVIGVMLAAWLFWHPMQTQSSWDAQVLYLLMTLVLICEVVRPAAPLLGGRLPVHVGKISYGIYLLHMFVICTVKKIPGMTSPAVCFFFSSMAVIVLASLVYKYFEHPIIVFYKRKLSPVRAKAAPPPAAATNERLKSSAKPAKIMPDADAPAEAG
ncbi:MAG TPA: acyltransferase [Candidatus Binatia bacterium]|nr:acyltransferase [Candidatus Binatia bacterium]